MNNLWAKCCTKTASNKLILAIAMLKKNGVTTILYSLYWISQDTTVSDLKVSHFFEKKPLEKWDTLGTFTQNVLFLDYNKTKKEKSGTLLFYTNFFQKICF